MAAPCARCRVVISGILFRRLAVKNSRFLSTNATSTSTEEQPSGQSSREEDGVNEENGDTFNTRLEEDHHGDPGESQTEADIKHRILSASLPFVREHGWSSTAIAAGAAAQGLPSVAHGMFPRGGAHLSSFFYQNCNKELAAKLKEEVETRMEADPIPSTTVFITNAVETRLRMIMPYMDTWHQAMAIQTLPDNLPEALRNLFQLMDDIWYYAGDRSHDFNWYTKRASLAGVYKSTEVYMIQDKSVDLQDTWEFLDNRISNLVTVGKYTANVQQMSGISSETVAGLVKMGKNLLGMNFKSR